MIKNSKAHGIGALCEQTNDLYADLHMRETAKKFTEMVSWKSKTNEIFDSIHIT